MTFLLYHYASASKGVFHELQTLNYRSSDLSNSFPSYRDSISFMFERPDFEKIADLYLKRGHKHPFWFRGHEINEYIVDLDRFRPRKNMKYSIVESPEKTALYYDESVSDSEYTTLLKEAVESNGYDGDNVKDLKKSWSSLRSRLRHSWMLDAYRKLMSSPNFEENKDKYAPTVPHLMLYLEEGVMKYETVSAVTIGDVSVKESVAETPRSYRKSIYSKW